MHPLSKVVGLEFRQLSGLSGVQTGGDSPQIAQLHPHCRVVFSRPTCDKPLDGGGCSPVEIDLWRYPAPGPEGLPNCPRPRRGGLSLLS